MAVTNERRDELKPTRRYARPCDRGRKRVLAAAVLSALLWGGVANAERNYFGHQLAVSVSAGAAFTFVRDGRYTFTQNSMNLRIESDPVEESGIVFSPTAELIYSYGFQVPLYLEAGVLANYESLYVSSLERDTGFGSFDTVKNLQARKVDTIFTLGFGTTTWSPGTWVEVGSGRSAGTAYAYGLSKLGFYGGVGFGNIVSTRVTRPLISSQGSFFDQVSFPADYLSNYASRYPLFLVGMRVAGSLGGFTINMDLGLKEALSDKAAFPKEGFINFGFGFLCLTSKDAARFNDPTPTY